VYFLFFNSDFFPKIQLKREYVWFDSQSASSHDTCCHSLFHYTHILLERPFVYLERNSRYLPSARQNQSHATWIPSLLLLWKYVTDTGRRRSLPWTFELKIRIDKKKEIHHTIITIEITFKHLSSVLQRSIIIGWFVDILSNTEADSNWLQPSGWH
jgi:hypothetical protein